jgi:hypothetical protein
VFLTTVLKKSREFYESIFTKVRNSQQQYVHVSSGLNIFHHKRKIKEKRMDIN